MQVIRATGAVADALRRYDPNLEVRYSWERKSWAIAFRTRRPDLIPPPIKAVPLGMTSMDGFVEELLPEKSEAYISYRTKTYPAAYVKRLSWKTYEGLISSDTQLQGSVKRQMKHLEEQRDIEYFRKKQDRYREARSFMNWHARTHPDHD